MLFAKDNPAVGIRVAYLVNAVIYAETLSKIDGAFELKVGAGQGYVRVFPPPGFITEHLGDVSVTIDTQTELNIKEPIRFKPLPAIEGTVVAGRGEPQAGCLITSLDLEAPYWAVTDSEGHFRIQLGKMPNTDEVSFRAEHPLRFLRNDFKINLGKIAPLKVQLKAFDPDLRPCDKMRAGNDLTRKVGKPAPEVHCREWIDTEPLSLEKLGGKVIVMTFWAEFDKTKSRNRLIEMTMIEKALREAEDVVFLGIHEAGAERAEVATCVHELGVDFAVGIDSGPSATFEAYNTNVIPQTVLIDKKGVLRYFDVEGRLLELIKSLRIEQ